MFADKLIIPKQFTWGSKAETLKTLQSLISHAVIPDLIFFTVAEWRNARDIIIANILKNFPHTNLAIRSSALIEDCSENSMAGAFLSLLNVYSDDKDKLEQAIDKVSQSMTDNVQDQILIQSMIENPAVSGVIMTYDVVHGAPYYCIDYDDESGRTDAVTGGNGIHKSLFVYRYSDDSFIRSSRILSFLKLARELENICDCDALDIEFVMNHSGQLFLLQARRISVANNWHPVTERRVKRQLGFIEKFIKDRSKKKDGLIGNHNIMAIMPDWNPAEIIGTTPRPLSSSLYRYLITQSVWRRAREIMGYRQLPDVELMVLVNNHPYIDVRNSFNSFLPANLEDVICEKLINSWLDRLIACPELHDKIEFEIVPTCIDFCFEADFTSRYPKTLNKREFTAFKNALTELTCNCLSGDTLKQALADAEKLSTLSLPELNRAESSEQLARAHYLLTQCKQFGSLAFAVVARHAFIAEALLRSAVKRGALTESRLIALKRSIRTITGEMVAEYSVACRNPHARSGFLQKYGHLRPGTYEITSRRYDERDDLFFNDSSSIIPSISSSAFLLDDDERNSINNLLNESQLNIINADELLAYAQIAIAGREQVKFIFTQFLSNALASLVKWGENNGLSRDDLSYLEWHDIVKCLTQPIMDDVDRHFLLAAETGRRNMEAAHAFKLAHIISDVRDIYVATQNRAVPNFVGKGFTSGQIVFLDASASTSTQIKDRIVCIENADPGFDWIFTKGISALVTQFGGANSHMAIRCAELGLPAAIGCGDQLFQRLLSANHIELNCELKVVRPIYAD